MNLVSALRFVLALGILLLVVQCGSAQDRAPGEVQAVRELIVDSDVAQLDEITPRTSLEILQLLDFPGDRNVVDDISLSKLTRFTNLRTLVLSGSQVTDGGLKHIAKLPHLKCLIVYDCQISDEGIQSLSVLSELQSVGFHGTRVSDEGIAKLKMSLKDTYFERGRSGTTGTIFDANGCIRHSRLRPHFRLGQVADKPND